MGKLLKPLEMAKLIVGNSISLGDRVVDATLGNGHDALFLAQAVGGEGCVYGFDIQKIAVENSTARLKEAGWSNYCFFCKGHEKMASFVPKGLAAVMFNLGYLPAADKAIISKTETTLVAIRQAMHLLRLHGVISIMCYPGHKGGDIESQAVEEFVNQLARNEWQAVSYKLANAQNHPAFLILMEKLKE
jgi:SAM-dependent methyltransferase